jgi:signal transduction histidine kinase
MNQNKEPMKLKTLKDKIVVVGATALGLEDRRVTPFHQYDPATSIQAQAIANIIEGTFLKQVPEFVSLFILILFGLAVILLTATQRSLRAFGFTFLATVFYLSIAYCAFLNDYWVNVAWPLTTMVILFVAMICLRYFLTAEELKKTYAQLVRAEKMASLGTLSASIAHEYRNFMAAISMAADSCTMPEIKRHDLDHCIDIIKRTVKKAGQVSEGLLTFARKTDSVKTAGRLEKTAEDVLLILEDALKTDDIQIKKEFAQMGLIYYDEGQIAQVLMNMLRNGRDALKNRTGGKQITLRLRDMGDQALIEIEDNGSGIPKRILNRLFEPFATSKKPGEGTGLGLSVCHGIILNHGGDIKVKTEEGKGTTWQIYLPKKEKSMSNAKVLIFILISGISIFMGSSAAMAQSKFIPDGTAQSAKNEPEAVVLADTFADGKAVISSVTGTVKILRSGTDEWVAIVEGNVLEEGDQIRTDSESSVDIVYDSSSLNTARIDENTIAEFRGLEPTFVYLADGSIFNSLEALPEGQDYEVATDTAVNAIRGTKFLRTFEAANQTDSTAVTDGSVESFSVLSDGTKSEESVFIQKDNALTLTPELLRTTPFSQLKPVLSSFETRKKIAGLEDNLQKRLAQSVGGPEILKEHRERARANMEHPEFHQAFQNKRRAMIEKRREALIEGRRPNITKPRMPGEEIKSGEQAVDREEAPGQKQFDPNGPKEQKNLDRLKHENLKHHPDKLDRPGPDNHQGKRPDERKMKGAEPGHNQHQGGPKPTGGGARPAKSGPRGGGAPGGRR